MKENKNKTKKTTFSTYLYSKMYVCPTGLGTPVLFTAAEPAAQHSGAQKKGRNFQDLDKRTITTIYSPVFSKSNQI